jgi:aquaporin Z
MIPGVLKQHFREFACEAIGLGTFMVSACAFSVFLFHSNSFASAWKPYLRFIVMGLAMGTTAIAIFISPLGRLSGAHINPAVTLTFLRLGKIKLNDAFFYIAFQFIGALIGVFFSWLVLRDALATPEVNFAITIPNHSGALISFFAEFIISFLMMLMVLVTTNHARLARFTPFVAGCFVATYIALVAPISGMSMNPARTFASALFANVWTDWWIYFTAPPMAMLLAAEIFLRLRGIENVFCAKFYHYGAARCIFNCRFDEMGKRVRNADTIFEQRKVL